MATLWPCALGSSGVARPPSENSSRNALRPLHVVTREHQRAEGEDPVSKNQFQSCFPNQSPGVESPPLPQKVGSKSMPTVKNRARNTLHGDHIRPIHVHARKKRKWDPPNGKSSRRNR